jgi:hypothetical protein
MSGLEFQQLEDNESGVVDSQDLLNRKLFLVSPRVTKILDFMQQGLEKMVFQFKKI